MQTGKKQICGEVGYARVIGEGAADSMKSAQMLTCGVWKQEGNKNVSDVEINRRTEDYRCVGQLTQDEKQSQRLTAILPSCVCKSIHK